MNETIGAALIFAGLLLAVAGLVWLVARGVAVLARRRTVRQMAVPLAVCAAGLVMGAVPFAYQHLYLAIVGLGERERVIDGERTLTLTGWDRHGYDILRSRTDVAILEMGNKDVGDDTLPLLADLPNLRELTLNDSSITDAGLPLLARLPRLESLRIARTGVTAEGVRAFLADPPPRLRQIDVSGNGIPVGILRTWKNAAAKPDGADAMEERRYVH
ncbi:MAG: hypothetical protein EBX36_06045 [Planctomycetia bacterium]|nr:hypothetical protein [Planctomycetia bacterium]